MTHLEEEIVRIRSSRTREAAFHQFNRSMEERGYNSNVYTLITDHPSIGEKSTHGLAASYPKDWLDHYNARRYQHHDPVWQTLLKAGAPFFWGDVIERLKSAPNIPEESVRASLGVMNEATEAGVTDGIGISFVSSSGEIAATGLSRRTGEKKRSYEDLAQIYLLASFFHEKYMGFYRAQALPRLTPRERDVLSWAAENKADHEIGGLLRISPATVRFHWKNIFAKLGVSGRVSAVAKSVQLCLITPSFVRGPYQGR